ncbi:MAG: NADH-quinone oxidoreductase subunit A [Chlamydiae bacterium]|nr:NADH-quinone oxidoreductase subunit A [Chlamydiota bacterium]MBI3267345.1 NADH-quinone oxidoreductase subunit A [Chlamydiota bacterium]
MMEYASLLIVFAFAAFVAGLLIFLTSILGPRRKSEVKEQPFECGFDPITLPRGRFGVKFYLVAMLFIIFDVELVFLFPWAVVFKKLGAMGLLEMIAFLGIVVVGLVYAWKKGALEWE